MAGNSVLAGLLVARLLGRDSLGELAAISVAVSIVLQFGSFGLANANLHFSAQDENSTVPAFVNGTIVLFVSGAVFAGAALLLSPWILPGVSFSLLAIALASIPFNLVTQANSYLFLGRGMVRTYNFLELANQSFVLINAILVLLILKNGLWHLVIFNSLASILISILVSLSLISFVSRQIKPTAWLPDKDLFRRMFAFAIKTNLTWVSTYLIYRLDLLIVSGFWGASETAVYSVASQVVLLGLLLPHAIATMFQHRVASGNDEIGFTLRVFRYSSFVLLTISLFAIPGAFLLEMLYGVGFSELPVLVAILSPGIYCAGMQIIVSQPLVGKELPVNLHTIWISALAVNVVLNLIFVPMFGTFAAAATSTFCYFAVFVSILTLFKRRRSTKISEIIVPRFSELRSSWSEFMGSLLVGTKRPEGNHND